MKTKERTSILLAFASWEDRFPEGLKIDLQAVACKQVVVFYYSDYTPKTDEQRSEVKAECRRREVDYEEVDLKPDRPHENLRKLDDTIGSMAGTSPLIVDISTMPREVIWYIFWLTENRETPLRYRYYRPKSYPGEWISRDPGRPRLVHKLSGIARPGLKTALLVVVGLDVQRVSQLVRFFEPSRLLVALQGDSPLATNDTNMRRYVDDLLVGETVSKFNINAYDDDHGYHVFEHEVAGLVENHNVILGSLGPKLTAVPLYRIKKRWPEIGLVYAPANEFNIDYSQGTGSLFEGALQQDST